MWKPDGSHTLAAENLVLMNGTSSASSATTEVRTIVVDRHQVVREGVRQMLGQYPDITVVGDFEFASELIDSSVLAHVDVLILDFNGSDHSSMDLIRSIRDRHLRTRVLIYCCQATTQELAQAVATGIAGYLPKRAGSMEIADAITSVARGGVYVHPSLQGRVMSFAGANGRDGRTLTEREYDVLRLMCEGHSNKTIAAKLGLTVGTVRVYVSRVLGKMGVSDRTQAVVEAVKRRVVRVMSG